MKKPISRRDFLRLAATGAGVLAFNELLAACGADELPTNTSLPPTDVPTATDEPTLTNTVQSPTNTPEATVEKPDSTATSEPSPTDTDIPNPDLVVVRNGDPDQMVRKAIAMIGGMEKYVFRGADVIVKPNICVDFRTHDWAATTNPWVVGTIVKMCFEAGAARVRVMDQTWKRNMTKAYQESGIQQQVEAAGGEMEWMPLEKFVSVPAPNAIELKAFDFYDEFLSTDVFYQCSCCQASYGCKINPCDEKLDGNYQGPPDHPS